MGARLREVAVHMEALPPKDREADVADERVPELVKNAFVDGKLVAALRTAEIATAL
jgi:hypothetical protein